MKGNLSGGLLACLTSIANPDLGYCFTDVSLCFRHPEAQGFDRTLRR